MIFNKHNHILEEKTKDFIQVLTDSPEYQSFKKAQDEFESDKDAKSLLSDFQNTQQTYVVFRQNGFSGTTELESKLRQLQHRLRQNQKINTLIRSQQELQALIADLVQKISREINFPFSSPQTGGGCCG